MRWHEACDKKGCVLCDVRKAQNEVTRQVFTELIGTALIVIVVSAVAALLFGGPR